MSTRISTVAKHHTWLGPCNYIAVRRRVFCDAILERAAERAGCGLPQRQPSTARGYARTDAAIACPSARPHARAIPEPACRAGIHGMAHSP